MRRILTLLIFVGLSGIVSDLATAAEVRTIVYLNGERTSVYFSDGDSFRILSGQWSRRGTRLSGFNTLESFGPVHSWGNWHPYELWVNAKMATYNARRGVWHCTTQGQEDNGEEPTREESTNTQVEGTDTDEVAFDTYGRLLVVCPDLAISQISQGFAHAMNVDDTPSRPEYLRAQQNAIRARRGMWAHGVPGFVLTSLHSRHEDPSRDEHYNRMVSTRDGHSERWIHNDVYPECSTQCATEIVADEEKVRAFARSLRQNPQTQRAVATLSNLLLIELVDRYARLDQLPEYTEEAVRNVVTPLLEIAKESGELGHTREVRGACSVYAAFERRYGAGRAACLQGRGELPPHRRGEQ